MTPTLADLLLATILLTIYGTTGLITAIIATATYLKIKEHLHK